ncbi:MAG: hypothetical protein KDI92_11450, partial [Xanthomonadales bacterium]|nr:hypothetical protein [Xanthomonadales bacterium]
NLVYSSVILEQPLEKYIEKAQLIVKGVVIKKEAKEEKHLLKQYTMSNGVLSENRTEVDAIYTTFTIKIDEILYGSHDEKTIDVKMLGGCNDEGSCLNISSNYDFEVENNIVLFLNFDEVNGFFRSTSNGITAYLVHENSSLVRAGEFVVANRNNQILSEKLQENKLTMEKLKTKIQDVKNEQ